MDHASMGGLATGGLWAAFLLGLTGGVGHCLAMCGPLVSAASLARGCTGARANGNTRASATVASENPVRVALESAGAFQAAYHAGRLLTYGLLGLALGALGAAGAFAGMVAPLGAGSFTQWLKLGAGALMLVAGTVLLVAAVAGRGARLPEPTAPIARARWFTRASRALVGGGPGRGFALGMLMGLLPCMPLLPVELAALATGQPLAGALTMGAFGLGTLPALASVGALAGTLGSRAQGALAALSGLVVIALGTIVVWQGLALATGA